MVTFKEFKNRAKKTHGNRYDYSLSKYSKMDEKVEIVCIIHGSFLQTPDAHSRGQGCPECGKILKGKKRRSTTSCFIEKSKIRHNNKYSYSKTIYTKGKNPVIVTCSKHGDFNQIASDHLNGNGCQLCGKEKTQLYKSNKDTKFFILKSKEIHGSLYDYSKSIYVKNSIPVEIVCKRHGSFFQNPSHHYLELPSQ